MNPSCLLGKGGRSRGRRRMAEETILTGDDLMLGPPSPIVPAEVGSFVTQNLDTCNDSLRRLFLCLHKNDMEPFCQDDLILFRRCAQKRDKELRQRIFDSEKKLGQTLPVEKARERVSDLQSQITLLERRLILASGLEGIEGFRHRWTLNGQLHDIKRRVEAMEEGLSFRKKDGEKGWFGS